MIIGGDGMPAGQPKRKKYDSIFQENDGEYNINPDDLIFDDFSSEKEMQKFICENINFFCENILEDKLKSFETEKKFGGASKNRKHLIRQKMRLDIFIECENSKYIVELKNPRFKRENREAIGQILAYGEYIDCAKLVLVTTMYDPDTEKIIRKYNLPIKYICLSKRTSYEFKEYRYL